MTTTSNTYHQYEEQNVTQCVQKEADREQYHKMAGDSREKGRIDIHSKSDPLQENEVMRTTSGCIVKKPDNLTYTQ